MKKGQSGVVSIITVVALVVLGVGTLVSSILISNRKKPQSISTKAATDPGFCRDDPEGAYGPGYVWKADCDGSLQFGNKSYAPACHGNDDCKQNTGDPSNVWPGTSNWCYGFNGSTGTPDDWRCLQLQYGGSSSPTSAPEPTSSGGGGGGETPAPELTSVPGATSTPTLTPTLATTVCEKSANEGGKGGYCSDDVDRCASRYSPSTDPFGCTEALQGNPICCIPSSGNTTCSSSVRCSSTCNKYFYTKTINWVTYYYKSQSCSETEKIDKNSYCNCATPTPTPTATPTLTPTPTNTPSPTPKPIICETGTIGPINRLYIQNIRPEIVNLGVITFQQSYDIINDNLDPRETYIYDMTLHCNRDGYVSYYLQNDPEHNHVFMIPVRVDCGYSGAICLE